MAYVIFDQIDIIDNYFFWGPKENEDNFMSTLVPKNGDFHAGWMRRCLLKMDSESNLKWIQQTKVDSESFFSLKFGLTVLKILSRPATMSTLVFSSH